MKRNLILIGSNGTLGTGVTEYLLNSNYDNYYLVNRKNSTHVGTDKKINSIIVNDLSVEKEMENLFAQIESDPEVEYFLFSTVGGFYASPILEMDYAKWKLMFILNVDVAFLLAKHFSRFVSKCKSGSICFTSAVTAKNPESNKSAYGASKSALEYLVKSLAIEGKEIGLTANAIAPFILDSPENREWVEDLSLLTSPKDVGFLIDDIFNRYKLINGNIIELKGKLL